MCVLHGCGLWGPKPTLPPCLSYSSFPPTSLLPSRHTVCTPWLWFVRPIPPCLSLTPFSLLPLSSPTHPPSQCPSHYPHTKVTIQTWLVWIHTEGEAPGIYPKLLKYTTWGVVRVVGLIMPLAEYQTVLPCLPFLSLFHPLSLLSLLSFSRTCLTCWGHISELPTNVRIYIVPNHEAG